MKIEKTPIVILIFFTLFFSFQILYAGLWVSYQGITCDTYFETKLIYLALCLMFVSVIGVVGGLRRSTSLLWLYVHCQFVLILLLLVFSSLGFYVTRKAKDGDYSGFLQRRVDDERNWEIVKKWLLRMDVCSTDYPNRFCMEHFSAIRSGCCRSCNFDEAALTECKAWDNNPSVMSFNCQSCKEGVLDTMRSDLEKVTTVCIVFLVCLIIVYSIICCILGCSSEDNFLKRYWYYLKHSWEGATSNARDD